MIKRNINLIVKLSAFILFVGILAIIYCCAENTSSDIVKNTTINSSTTEITPEVIVPETNEVIDTETTLENNETAPITETVFESEQITDISLKTSPVLFTEIQYICYYDIKLTEELAFKIQVVIERLEKLNMDEYTYEAATAIEVELNRLIELEQKVSSDLKHFMKWEKEYYYATKVWEYFMQRGFSSEITCAIIGNMMIETAGGTLKLNPTIYSPSGNYYGLCQWSQSYYPETKDISFEAQLEYLLGSMPWEFNTFGKLYKKGFNYVEFLKMTDTSKAAKAFAVAYERCGEGSYKLRQEAALRAYAYFDLTN